MKIQNLEYDTPRSKLRGIFNVIPGLFTLEFHQKLHVTRDPHIIYIIYIYGFPIESGMTIVTPQAAGNYCFAVSLKQIKIQNYKRKLFLLLILITLIILNSKFLILNSIAHAQSLALSISPPILEVMIRPGKSITQVYKLANTGEPVAITPKIFELGTSGVKEDEAFVKDKWISIISNDIDFDKPFILGSNKEAEFLLKISPTVSTAEKDYYRALVFATTPNLPSDTTMSSFAQNLAVPVLVTVTSTGSPVKAAQIVKFELPKIIDSFDPLVTNIQIKNTGNSYFRPVGKINLTGPVGKGSYDLIPSALLTGETKQILTSNESSNPELQSLYLPGFYIGKYQLELVFALDNSGIKISSMKIFYAIPWKGTILLILFILGIKLLKPALSRKRRVT